MAVMLKETMYPLPTTDVVKEEPQVTSSTEVTKGFLEPPTSTALPGVLRPGQEPYQTMAPTQEVSTTPTRVNEIDGVTFEQALQGAGVVKGDGEQTDDEIIAGGQVREQYGRSPYRPGSYAAQVYNAWKSQQTGAPTTTSGLWRDYLDSLSAGQVSTDPRFAELDALIKERVNNPQKEQYAGNKY